MASPMAARCSRLTVGLTPRTVVRTSHAETTRKQPSDYSGWRRIHSRTRWVEDTDSPGSSARRAMGFGPGGTPRGGCELGSRGAGGTSVTMTEPGVGTRRRAEADPIGTEPAPRLGISELV